MFHDRPTRVLYEPFGKYFTSLVTAFMEVILRTRKYILYSQTMKQLHQREKKRKFVLIIQLRRQGPLTFDCCWGLVELSRSPMSALTR